ncbi:hypothetical protein LOK49_LG12G00655 [Camellia lanceoleosa]|uniref:Uncharacterized protein n=1 Tax=Camellia lanceoleosa TaxID=1840588 RepID=A0ACC0FSN4_9ERIC|nr:hypothetical protein LOK49_LG12G00655 [Camellia lanceoleosa]
MEESHQRFEPLFRFELIAVLEQNSEAKAVLVWYRKKKYMLKVEGLFHCFGSRLPFSYSLRVSNQIWFE